MGNTKRKINSAIKKIHIPQQKKNLEKKGESRSKEKWPTGSVCPHGE